jgi:alanine racemase
MATVAIGYADGYPRALAGKGQGWINGKKVPLIGRVSMDLCTFDVSMTENVKINDEIELIGDNIGLEDVAHAAGTIGYEILTALGSRYERIIR